MATAERNKFRNAIDVLQRGRDVMVESLAEEIIFQGDDLADGGFLLNELLETQGTRLHFLSLLIGQLEQSAEVYEEAQAPPPPPPRPRSRSRTKSKKLQEQTSKEGSPDDV